MGYDRSLGIQPVRRCASRRADGQRCRANAQSGKRYCFFHDPRQRRRAAAVQRAGGVARTLGTPPPFLPGEPTGSRALEKPRTVAQVVELLGETINQVRAGELGTRTANALGFLCMNLVNAIEKGILEKRLAELERAVAARGNQFSEQFPVPGSQFSEKAEETAFGAQETAVGTWRSAFGTQEPAISHDAGKLDADDGRCDMGSRSDRDSSASRSE